MVNCGSFNQTAGSRVSSQFYSLFHAENFPRKSVVARFHRTERAVRGEWYDASGTVRVVRRKWYDASGTTGRAPQASAYRFVIQEVFNI